MVAGGEVALWDFRGLAGGFDGLRGGRLCHRSFSPTARLFYSFYQHLYMTRREMYLRRFSSLSSLCDLWYLTVKLHA